MSTKTLSNRIKDLVVEKGMSLAQLERVLDFSNGSIARWDKSSPSVDKVDKVAKYFNVSLDYLLCKTDHKGCYNPDFNLTDKEEKDVAKRMGKIKEQLISEQGLMFDGEILDEETAQLLLEAIEQQERMVKVINRKYTRKDYRK